MMDQQFRLFVKNNISLLDELSRMYAEYRIDVCESFWEELSRTLNVDIPDGYFYFTSGKRFEFGSKEERLCGWRRDISELIGVPQRDMHVCFGTWSSSESIAHGEWLISRPWTGIYVWLDTHREEEANILAAINKRQSSVRSEAPDNNWRLYRIYQPLDVKIVTPTVLNDSLTSDARLTHVGSIKADLVEWVKEVEGILSQVR